MYSIKRLYSFGLMDGSYGLGTLKEIVDMEKESEIYSCSLATLEELEWWILTTGETFKGQLIEIKEGIYWLGNVA